MEIRKPNRTELEEIMKLSPQSLFEGTMGRFQPSDEKAMQLVEPLLEKGCYYLVATTESNSLTGWVLVGSSKDQMTDDVIGYIYELYVIQEFRGKGISRQLLKSAIENLKREGYLEIRLNVFAENHAIQLYEKMGFSVRALSMSLPL
ncbi:GNAT family N-acetyltransferase [Tumebacillus sp. ITR2]|uniref:GNAT family N-acetyltransferase n=1 Tax=Tumebacillus amylolyticus TaxID=2801339 RepID=A0ABS1JC34_9BACL|nr:GNAT family N-acetyltransferase [Tumebacillus amylolyticus]MBL0387770.1 GNAT family N-acetyltransferase [Tumebacillus amylolyticus]